jgi:hypothetical protein
MGPLKRSKATAGHRVYGTALLVAGVLFAVLAIVVATQKLPLIVRGVTTTGTLVDVDENARARNRTGFIEFRDGAGIGRRIPMTSVAHHNGDTVEVRYLPSDPRRAAEHSIATTWGALIALPLLSLLLFAAGRAISRPDSARKRRRR